MLRTRYCTWQPPHSRQVRLWWWMAAALSRGEVSYVIPRCQAEIGKRPLVVPNSEVVASITSFSVAGCCARAANRTTGPVSLKTPRDFERPSPWPDRGRRASSRPCGGVPDNRGNIRDTRVSTRLELQPACLRRCHQQPSTRLHRQADTGPTRLRHHVGLIECEGPRHIDPHRFAATFKLPAV